MSLSYGGLRVQINHLLVETVLHARSPGRARRRIKRGYPQHYRMRPSQAVYRHGDTLVMHPTVWEQLRAHIDATQK